MVETIYIRLLNEGTDVWRPTGGEKIGKNTYRVLQTKDYDSEDEEWEFLPGAIVECELQIKTSDSGKKEKVPVAVRDLS